LPILPHSPDLTSSNFFLLPVLKGELPGLTLSLVEEGRQDTDQRRLRQGILEVALGSCKPVSVLVMDL
jgi:hypothetical protein